MSARPLTRVGFAGTPAFSATVLAALIDAGRAPVAVWTQPDRRAGRGRKLAPSEVKQCALAHDLPVLQPQTLSDPSAQEELRALDLDLLIVVAYGLLLPQVVLESPRRGCVNVHASLLPRWRGAAPIQAAIAAGDAETGVCIMQMDAGLDTGPVLLRASQPLASDANAASLTTELSHLGAQTLLSALNLMESCELLPAAQDDASATYARRINKADAELDFIQPASTLERLVRAHNPWPVSFTSLGDERLRIWHAQVLTASALANNGNGDSEPAPPGTILRVSAEGIDVATGDGVLRLLELQRAGGKRLSVAEFIRARMPDVGAQLGASASPITFSSARAPRSTTP